MLFLGMLLDMAWHAQYTPEWTVSGRVLTLSGNDMNHLSVNTRQTLGVQLGVFCACHTTTSSWSSLQGDHVTIAISRAAFPGS